MLVLCKVLTELHKGNHVVVFSTEVVLFQMSFDVFVSLALKTPAAFHEQIRSLERARVRLIQMNPKHQKCILKVSNIFLVYHGPPRIFVCLYTKNSNNSFLLNHCVFIGNKQAVFFTVPFRLIYINDLWSDWLPPFMPLSKSSPD